MEIRSDVSIFSNGVIYQSINGYIHTEDKELIERLTGKKEVKTESIKEVVEVETPAIEPIELETISETETPIKKNKKSK